MTWHRHMDLDENGRAVFQTTAAFIRDRLNSYATINWALKLLPSHVAERQALLALLESMPAAQRLEPWTAAWRLIEEFWDGPDEEHSPVAEIRIRHRLAQGERSGAIIAAIVRMVSARLAVEPRDASKKRPKKPSTIHDVLAISFTGNEPINPTQLGLGKIKDGGFLNALAAALDISISENIDRIVRFGWGGDKLHWRLGFVRRVYYVTTTDEREHEPDDFGRGIATAVKTLHAVVAQLAKVDAIAAKRMTDRWRDSEYSLYRRSWAAVGRDPQLASADDVSQFFADLSNEAFWDVNEYPEIAELRASRYADLSVEAQAALTRRLRKLPSRTFWRGETDQVRVKSARLYWAVRELRRIQGAGGVLPKSDITWLAAHVAQFPALAKPVPLDEGFLDGFTVRAVQPNPDSKYDLLSGVSRLRALESGLTAGRVNWEDDPASRASDWIRGGANVRLLVADFEAAGRSAGDYPLVWERFGWTHTPGTQQDRKKRAVDRELVKECQRVVALLMALPDATIEKAIDGITHWLTAWEDQIVRDKFALSLWKRFWPLAVEATNAREAVSKDFNLSAVVGSDDREPRDLDTLNTPAGRMVGIFIAAWSATKKGTKPFAARSKVRIMRDIIIAADGRSGLIGKHRLIEHLPYFHHADINWTKTNLLPHLMADTPDALSLWRAVARHRLDGPVMRLLGKELITRTDDKRLGRETRKSLVFSIIVNALHALRHGKRPAVPVRQIQQMLRATDDEIRAHAADTVVRFVRDNVGADVRPEALFANAARPFLEQIWPQERSLSTPNISKALADLPANSGGAFADAVNVIERFLVPFDCWSLLDFGLFGDEKDQPKLAQINTSRKAQAFLHLLDLSVGTKQGAVIPYDLSQALEQIRQTAPALEEIPAFRRLSAAARR